MHKEYIQQAYVYAVHTRLSTELTSISPGPWNYLPIVSTREVGWPNRYVF